MGSEGNKMNGGTSFQLSEPALCANGCGFFGTAATMNLCSKCFRDLRIQEEEEQAANSARLAREKLAFKPLNNPQPVSSGIFSFEWPSSEVASTLLGQALPNRCHSCRKRIGIIGSECKCGRIFCGSHRYPELHDCNFDYKSAGRESIAKENPVVKADKIDQRI